VARSPQHAQHAQRSRLLRRGSARLTPVAAPVALLLALAGSVGCAAVPAPRKLTFREAGLLDDEPAAGPEGAATSAPRPPATGPVAGLAATHRPAMPPRFEPDLPVVPPVRDVAPESAPSEPPSGPLIDPILLRFAGEARNRRLRATTSPGFPPEAEAAWRTLVAQLDDYLARPLPQTPLLELVRSSVTLEAEWAFDQRRYGPPPADLDRLVTGRDQRLARRIATSRAIGQTLFAARPPGRLRWPIENAGLSSAFGPRDHPLNGTRQLHAGIDLAADRGRVVSAAAPGYVVSAHWAGGYGLLVEVRHPGDLTTRYGHLSALLCAPGDPVETGAPLGLIGQTGLATGPHLHFEVWEGGQPRDPLAFIGGGTGLAAPYAAAAPVGGPR
jgi:murein DD-endopeptidase MepM/ murein hydrolase activator NlpD